MNDAERHQTAKLGMWLFLSTEVMMFAGFIAAYIVLRAANPSMTADAAKLDRTLALVNTLVLITSSLLMALAVNAIREGHAGRMRLFLAGTVLLGFAFLAVKSFEYVAKFSHGITSRTSIFFSCYFTMTGLHGLHVVGGIVTMLILLALSRRFNAQRYVAVENAGLYWHFVDIVWIFLFPMLYLV
ncbi:MAG: cytochrome c oxidase subunit 3 [Planctomycetes bacterium]|nr:cytochrome c oxidase subunit 3 [Planctomycetota bacterium]